MYVCLCHGFTDRQVRSALNDGAAGSTAGVFRHFGCRPRCGKCVGTVRELVEEARDARDQAQGCAGLCYSIAAE